MHTTDFNPPTTNYPSQRLQLSFRRDADGYWLGQHHVCGNMEIAFSPGHESTVDWLKEITAQTQEHDTLGVVFDRDAALYNIEEIVGLLSKHLWIDESDEGTEAFQALLLLFWTERRPVEFPPEPATSETKH